MKFIKYSIKKYNQKKEARRGEREREQLWGSLRKPPTHSELFLSSDFFSENDKLNLNPTNKVYSLKMDVSIHEFDHVESGQYLGKIVSSDYSMRNYEIDAKIYSHREGFLIENEYKVPVGGLLATFFDNIDEAIEAKYPIRQIIINEYDALTNSDKIQVKPHIEIGSRLYFSIECFNRLLNLKLTFETKELSIVKGDKIDFLFEKSKLHFCVCRTPLRDSESSKKRVCYIPLNINEFNTFIDENLLMIRITSKEQDIVDIKNSSRHASSKVMAYHVRKVAQLFQEKLDELGINLVRLDDNIESEYSSSCFVYIMKDESNGSHKIGISNKPEYREKTLQSDKPYIVLLQAKEFPSRTLARAFESALHKTYEFKHLRGEWFNLSVEEAQEVIQSLK